MLELQTISSLFLLGLGAIIGSSLRFLIIYKWNSHYMNSYLRMIFVNSLASFSLGFIVSLEKRLADSYYSPLTLFFSVGLFGSFSTFSSFIWEVFDNLMNHNWSKSLIIIFTSIFAGLSFAYAGYHLANVWQ